VPTVVASRTDTGFTSFGRLATPMMCNEPNRVRGRYGSRICLPQLSEQVAPTRFGFGYMTSDNYHD